LAFQLGVYCGYVLHGVRGALAVALAFAAAPFVLVTLVAWLYVLYGSTWELRAIFYGVGPVVIAIIARSCWDLGRKTLRRQWAAFVFAAAACIITIVLQQELIALFLVAGALGIVVFYQGNPAMPANASPRKPSSGSVATLLAVTSSLYQSGTKNFLVFLQDRTARFEADSWSFRS
jgi:chromate transporter